MKLIALLALILSINTFATTAFDTEQGRQFLELYEQDGTWRVDSFLVRPGKLQEKLFSRSFPTLTEAQNFSDKIQAGREASDKSFSPTPRETGAVQLWTVSEQWSAAWEEKYSLWVKSNLTKDFFQKNNLATDCADVAYALRWIFARNNKLPAAGTLAATGLVVTQDDGKAEWARLATHAEWQRDQRFLKALNWLLDNVYTRTLYKDTFPLEITAAAIRPGAINLLGGHTELVVDVIDDGRTIPIQLLSSTVPRQVRELYARAFTDGSPVEEANGGLVQFRWPVRGPRGWSLVAKESMPLYSREQYNRELCSDTQSFAMCVYKRLNMSFNPYGAVDSIVESLRSLALARVAVVRQGLAACAQIDCAPGTQGWEDWSTPSRDKRLREAFESANQVVNELASVDWNLTTYFSTKLNDIELVDVGANFRLGLFLRRHQLELASYDPRDGTDSRWAATARGIGLTVKNLIDRTTPLRNKLIAAAEGCRSDRSRCETSSAQFKSHQTIELDYNWRKAVQRYNKFCLTETCAAEIPTNSWDFVWFMSSLPWDSVASRQGSSQGVAHKTFYALTQLIELGDHTLINQTLHHKDGTTLDAPAGTTLTYHPRTRRLFAHSEEGIFLFQKGQFVKLALPAEVILTENTTLAALGNNHLVIYGYDSGTETSPMSVVNLTTGTLAFSHPNRYYTNASSDEFALSVLLNNEEGSFFLAEGANGALSTRAFAQSETPDQLWGRDGNGWIGLKTTAPNLSTVYRYTPNGRTELVVLPTIYSYVDLGNEWLVQIEGAIWRLGKNDWLIRKRYQASWTSQTKVYGASVIHFYQSDSSQLPFSLALVNGAVVELPHPQSSEVAGVHSDWISFVDEKKTTVFDWQGQRLVEFDLATPMGCHQTLENNGCATSNPKLALWKHDYWETPDKLWEITNFGFYGELAGTRTPILQKVHLSDASEEGTYLSSHLQDGGTLFSPASGVVIYLPKQ